jgi:hypothetical protein
VRAIAGRLLLLVAAFLVQWLWFPTWLVASRAGLQTLLQALPAALIALLALAFAALFVVIQQVVGAFSSRATLVLAEDVRIRRVIGTTVLLAVLPIAVAGQVPDQGAVPHWLTALVATAVLGTALLALSYFRFVLTVLLEYTAPRSFVSRMIAPTTHLLSRGALEGVVWRVPSLGEAARYSIRRGDSVTLGAALDGLLDLQAAYISVAAAQPALRSWSYGRDHAVEGWLGNEMNAVFVQATEEALRLGSAENEVDHLVDAHGEATARFIRAHQIEEARAVLEGLAQLGVTSHQVGAAGINFLSRPLPAIARCEAEAESRELWGLAARALALWATCTAYTTHQFEMPHPLFGQSQELLGPTPPWESAISLVETQEWQARWANKLPGAASRGPASLLRAQLAWRDSPPE